VGCNSPFSLIARDRHSNICARDDRHLISASITGASVVPCEITTDCSGTYQCMYTPLEVGTHTVVVRLGGRQIPGSPFSVMASRAAVAEKCSATGSGLTKAIVGVPAELIIVTRDEFDGRGATGTSC
jgi:hypothetical protein